MDEINEIKDRGNLFLHWNFEVLNAENCNALKDRFNQFEINPPNKVFLDLKNVQYLDSSGVGTLLLGKRLLQESDTPFILLNPSDRVSDLLRLAQIDQLFEIDRQTGNPFSS